MARKDYGGSVYDQQYFTDDELRRAAEIRAALQAGETKLQDAHDYVENIRKGYGYSGGDDGSRYIQLETLLTAAAQNVQNTPYNSYQNSAYQSTVEPYKQIEVEPYQPLKIDVEPYKAQDIPDYVSPYQSQIDELYNRINNREAFSYDYQTDPQWQSYHKQYTREGQRAAADALANAAALTGGMPSTAAVAASQQAQNYYAAQAADKIPELYKAAYSMYTDEGNRLMDQLGALRGMESDSYSQYRNKVADTQYANAQAYSQYRDRVADANYANEQAYRQYLDRVQNANYLNEQAYGRYRDSIADQRYNDETAYSRSRDSLADQRYNDETAYSRYRDTLSDAAKAYSDLVGLAELGGNYGDYGYLNELGITPNLENIASMTTAGSASLLGKTTSGGGGSGGGKGYNNGNVDLSDIKRMQNALGVDDDGKWGPKTQAAAKEKWGTTSADEAWKKYNGGSVQTNESAYGNGYVSMADLNAETNGSTYNKSSGLSASAYNMAGNGIRENLQKGNMNAAVDALDAIWNKLNSSQRETMQNILRQYGVAYQP